MKKLSSRLKSILTVGAITFAVGTASAAQLIAPATDDAMIFDNGSGSDSGNASGKGPGIFAGADNTPTKKRSLVKFDLSSISTSATVTSVQLDMVIGQIAGSGGMGCGMACNPASRTYTFYQVDYDSDTWVEGNTGLTACNSFTTTCSAMTGTGGGWAHTGCMGMGMGASCGNDVSWKYFNASGPSLWHHGSGSPQDQDFGTTASVGASPWGNGTGLASYTFSSFTINATMSFASNAGNQPGFMGMVQDWVSTPSHNNGMEIRAASLETMKQSFIGWWTRDADPYYAAALTPVLTVNY